MTTSGWQEVSVRLMATGDMLALRSLLAKVQLDTGLSYSDVCKPSGYNYINGRFDARGKAYESLKSLRKRIKKKRDVSKQKRHLVNLVKDNRRMEGDMQKTRVVMADIKNAHRHFVHAQANFGKQHMNSLTTCN